MSEELQVFLIVYPLVGLFFGVILLLMNFDSGDYPIVDTWYWPSPIKSKQDALMKVAFMLGYPIVIAFQIGKLLGRILKWYIKLPDTKEEK